MTKTLGYVESVLTERDKLYRFLYEVDVVREVMWGTLPIDQHAMLMYLTFGERSVVICGSTKLRRVL